MGWAGGSTIFAEVIRTVKANVKDPEVRYRIYKDLIRVFEGGADCDTLNECVVLWSCFDEAAQDSMFDRAYFDLNPGYLEDIGEEEDDGT